jgi:hypothetical protein
MRISARAKTPGGWRSNPRQGLNAIQLAPEDAKKLMEAQRNNKASE